ncbi:UNVERIFIED_CONTAM: hypothetical protein K2H54_077890 [Gekko kuhli]
MAPNCLLATLDLGIFPDLGGQASPQSEEAGLPCIGDSGLQGDTPPDQPSRKETSRQENKKMGQVIYLCLLGCLLLNPLVEGAKNGTVVEARARCPASVLYYKQFCYQYVTSYVSWHLAEVTCQSIASGNEAHLASILSPNEGKIIASYLSSKSASSVWIGLEGTRSIGYTVWEWADASPLSLTLWDGRSLSTASSSSGCISMDNILNSTPQPHAGRRDPSRPATCHLQCFSSTPFTASMA